MKFIGTLFLGKFEADTGDVMRGKSGIIFNKSKRVSIESLPYPYKIKCRNYNDFELESKENALSNCFLKKSIEKYNTTCCDVPIELNSTIKINYHKHIQGFDDIIDDCYQKYYQPDCSYEFSITIID